MAINYTLVNNPGNLFTLDGKSLRTTTSPLPAGSYNYTVKATDENGWEKSYSGTIIVEFIPVVVTYNKLTRIATGMARSGQVNIFVDNVSVGSTNAGSDTNWSYTFNTTLYDDQVIKVEADGKSSSFIIGKDGWLTPSFFANSLAANDSLDATTLANSKKTLGGVFALGASLSNKTVSMSGTFTEAATFPPQMNVRLQSSGINSRTTLKGNIAVSLAWEAYTGNYGPTYTTNPGFEIWPSSNPSGWTGSLTNGTSVFSKDTTTKPGDTCLKLSVGTANTSIGLNSSSDYQYSTGDTLGVEVINSVVPSNAVAGIRVTIVNDDGVTLFLKNDGTWDSAVQTIVFNSSSTASSPGTFTLSSTVPTGVTAKNAVISLQRGAISGGGTYTIYYYSASLTGPVKAIPANTFRAPRSQKAWTCAVNDEFYNVMTNGEGLENKTFCWINNYLYIRDSRATGISWFGSQIIEVDDLTIALQQTTTDIGSLEIRNLNVRGYSGRAFRLDRMNNSIFSNNRFEGLARGITKTTNADNNGAIGIARSQSVLIEKNFFDKVFNDGIYLFDVKKWVLRNNIVMCVNQATADCFQADYFTDGSNSAFSGSRGPNGTGSGGIAEDNYFDQRNTRSPKGCFIVTDGDGDLFKGNISLGGLFGHGINGNNQTIEQGFSAYQVGAGEAGGFYASVPYSLTNHTIRDCISYRSMTGISRVIVNDVSGLVLTGDESDNNILVDHVTIAFSNGSGMSFGKPTSGTIRNSISYNPTATGPDLYIKSVKDVISLDYMCYGPARTGQFRVGNTFYDSLAAFKAAYPDWNQNSISADPLFVDALNGDFTLQSGSPCIGRASDGGNIGARGAVLAKAKNKAWFKSGTTPPVIDLSNPFSILTKTV